MGGLPKALNISSVKALQRQALFSATVGFFVGFAAVALFGPTVHKFKEVLNLTPVMVGFLVSTPALTGSLLRIPFSAWANVEGGRKPFLTLLTLAIVGMLGLTIVIFFFYPSRLTPEFYWLLLLLGLFCGCGIATFSVGITQVSYWYPQKAQGSALGAYAGYGNLAPGLFSLILPFCLLYFGLALSYLFWLAILSIGTVIYLLYARNALFFQLRVAGENYEKAKELAVKMGQEIIPSGNLISALSISARIWKSWVLVFIYFGSFGGFIALTAWFPTFWKSFYSTSVLTAGILTAIYSILTSIVRVYGGKLSDRLGGLKTIFSALIITLIGSTLMSFSGKYALSILSAIVMAIGMGTTNAAVFKLVPQEVPKAVGGAAGWVGGLGALGGFAIPPILGAFVRIYGNEGYSFGFITFVILALLSLLSTLLLAFVPNPRWVPAQPAEEAEM